MQVGNNGVQTQANLKPETVVQFVGKVWKNTTKTGKEYMRLTIDRGMSLSLIGKDSIELWPNKKREGKQDADFRASVRIPANN